MRVGSSQWQKLQSDIAGLQSDLAREKEENLAASAIKCPHRCNQQPDSDSVKRENGESNGNECSRCCDLQSKIDNLQSKLDMEKWERRENTNYLWFSFLWFAFYQMNRPTGRR